MAYKEARQKERETELDGLLEQRTPKKPLEGPLGLEFIAGMLRDTRVNPQKRTRGHAAWRNRSH